MLTWLMLGQVPADASAAAALHKAMLDKSRAQATPSAERADLALVGVVGGGECGGVLWCMPCLPHSITVLLAHQPHDQQAALTARVLASDFEAGATGRHTPVRGRTRAGWLRLLALCPRCLLLAFPFSTPFGKACRWVSDMPQCMTSVLVFFNLGGCLTASSVYGMVFLA